MKIHGVRIYPQSLNVIRGSGSPIFVHGRVSEHCSDFFYIFGPLASIWGGHFFAEDFGISHNEDGTLEDPMPQLREEFGASLVDTNLETQLMLLRGDHFSTWGKKLHFCEGAFLPIFGEPTTFELLKQLYWNRDFKLTDESWPHQMKALLHMWDDIYWQFFSTDWSEIELLIQTHANDPKLKMYFADLDKEFPDPSNDELRPAIIDKPRDV